MTADEINNTENSSTEQDADYQIISFSSIDEIEKSIVESPFRAIYQTNNFLLPQVINVIDDVKTVNLRPEYQRRSRWTNKQKSLLIESFILNIPIPPIFLYEEDFARYEVMDGQQRLIAIREFLTNQFKLSSLTILSPLNGRNYANLPPRSKRTLERASLSAIVLLKESRATLHDSTTKRTLELRKFIFERLNTGGKSLNAQELRNAVYSSKFNDLLIMLARQQLFTEVWSIPAYPEGVTEEEYYESSERKQNNLYKTMGDCQIVLRYFALREENEIKGSMRSILDARMAKNLQLQDTELGKLSRNFITRFEVAEKPSESMFDAVMVSLDRLWHKKDQLLEKKEEFQSAYWEALDSPEKIESFSGRANTAADVKSRISKMFKLMEGVLGHDGLPNG
jgi:Protein of unknown function DUF262